MPTECTADLLGFARVEGRNLVAAFDGATITLDVAGLLPGATDRAMGHLDRLAACFREGWLQV